MIEVQIQDQRLYESLKGFASYSSDLTHVCAFRDSLRDVLMENGVEVQAEEPKAKPRPVLTIEGTKVMRIDNATSELLHYCGVRSEFDPTVPISRMNEVNELIRSNIVDVGKRFRDLYAPMGYRGKIRELVCASVSFRGKGKLLDFIDGDLTIQSLRFPEARTKEIPLKQMMVKIVMPQRQSDDTSMIGALIDGGNCFLVEALQYDSNGVARSDRKVVMRFYGKPLIMKGIAYPGNRINICCQRITEGKNGELMTTDPMILPDGMHMNKMTAWSPPNRSIPADLWRNALFEFQCRYEHLWDVNDKLVK